MEEHNSEAEAGKFTYRLGIHEYSDMVSGEAKVQTVPTVILEYHLCRSLSHGISIP